MKSEGLFTIADVINSLNDTNRATVLEFHQLGVSLGCKEAISSMGKKVDDWKCEYTTKKPKRALFILRVNKKGWSIRCKLFKMQALFSFSGFTRRGLGLCTDIDQA